MAQSNLATRFLTAAIAGPLLIALVYLGPDWAWASFMMLATGVGAWELFGMTHPEDRVSHVVGVVFTVAVFAVLWHFGTDARAVIALLLVLPILAQFVTLARLGDMKSAALRTFALGFAPIWIGGGMAALTMVRREAGADGPGFVLLSLMLSWLSDTGAYFAGRFLGKRKLYEAVSPKKTVAGAFGGLAGSVVGALLASFLYLKSLPVLHGIGLAIVAGAAGQAGDLGESLIKRSVGVKDSGGIVPGHGGILDRVDATLVTSTILFLYVLFVRG